MRFDSNTITFDCLTYNSRVKVRGSLLWAIAPT